MLTDADILNLAARLALRAAGHVEPNPMVGAAIVRDGQIIGLGHHRRFGGPHAEREALADCRARGHDPRGSTLYVTLEPCSHHGKTPPCTDAVIEAGIARVIAARPDPNPISGGGAAILRRAGIPVDFTDASPLATHLSDPFVKRITTGLPWVIAKWAQFPDGRMVTREGEPRWISGEVARRRIHRLRARVDAILTGIGTVLADDPLLTVRGVRPRRTPMRVVLDPRLEIPISRKLVQTASQAPLLICTTDAGLQNGPQLAALTQHDLPILALTDPHTGRIDIPALLRSLARNGATNILVEAGPRLLKALFEADLFDAAIVHTAPENKEGSKHATDTELRALFFESGPHFRLCRTKQLRDDTERVFWRDH